MKHRKPIGQNWKATGLLCLDGTALILTGFILICLMRVAYHH